MTEPMALTAVAGLLAAIAAGSYLYRTDHRCPLRGVRACTADEPASGPPLTVHAVRNGGRNRRDFQDPYRGVDRHHGVERTTSPRRRTVSNAATFGLFSRPGPADVGVHPVVAMSAGAGPTERPPGPPRAHKTLYRADLQDALPLAASADLDELHLAVRAVRLHTPREWPGGLYCSNDRSPFPCRLRRWGEEMLLSAGWSAEDIAYLGRQADSNGLPPAR